MTLRLILAIVKRFARISLFVCVNRRDVTDVPAGKVKWLGQSAGPGEVRAGQTSPERLFSCRGQGHARDPAECGPGGSSPVERIDRMSRYGVRAFSALEGYASRNRETELAPPQRAHSHRRSSRLRSVEGRREAPNWLLCACTAKDAVRAWNSLKVRAAAGVQV